VVTLPLSRDRLLCRWWIPKGEAGCTRAPTGIVGVILVLLVLFLFGGFGFGHYRFY
jgi:hypothetical protein